MWGEIISKLFLPSILALAVIFGNQLANVIREIYKKRGNKTPLQSNQMDLEISSMITRIRDKWDCQRVYFARFHNGEHYVDNSDILKYTRTHEATRQGVTYEKFRQDQAFERTLVSRVPEEMALVEEPGASYHLTNVFHRDSYFSWLLRSGGVKAVARCKVTDRKGYIIGFVGADFDKEDECPKDIDLLCRLAYDIGQMIFAR